jgi:hypothetical protein
MIACIGSNWAPERARRTRKDSATCCGARGRKPDTARQPPCSGRAPRRRAVTIIVDIIHMLDYVWKAAWAFHSEGSSQAERWVDERLLEILRGRASWVAAGMRRSATLRGLTDKQRAAVDNCADYLLSNAQYLRYDEYLAKGMPISTGGVVRMGQRSCSNWPPVTPPAARDRRGVSRQVARRAHAVPRTPQTRRVRRRATKSANSLSKLDG